MKLKIGDQVVHPHYGVGQVVKVDDREFEPGVMRRYYEISIPGSTVWVSLDLPSFGLRKLAAKSEISRCRKVLAAPPEPLVEDPRLRQSDLSGRLKEGSILTHCEVVRDLFAFGAHKPVSGSLGAFFKVTQEVLQQEWAIVEGVTLLEAAGEIGALLEKSKLTMGEQIA